MNPTSVAAHSDLNGIVTAEAARELTDRIKMCVEQIWELIKQAYVSRAWIALEYRTWDDYCAAEFDRARIRIPREDRQEVVASMREIGMSTRAIAAATGLGYGTVQRDLPDHSGDPNGSPELVLGKDGKSYLPKPTDPELFPLPDPEEPLVATDVDEDNAVEAPRTRKRGPLTDSFLTARRKLVTDTKALTRLVDDDRFARHAAQLAHQHRSDLERARDALQAVIDRLPEQSAQEG